MEVRKEIPTAEFSDKEKFEKFRSVLQKHGFRLVGQMEKTEYQSSIGLEPPKGRRPRPGQVPLVYFHVSQIQVWVWPTYSPKQQKLIKRRDAMGWVLMLDKLQKEGEQEVYYRPVKRQGLYWNTLLHYAIACKERTERRPRCSECGNYMDVDLPFKYVDLEGETVEEKFLDYMIHYIPEVVELENLPLMLPTRETAIGFLEDEIVRQAMLNFTLRYGKDVDANPRFIASSVVDKMTEKGWLPRELKIA